MNSKLLHCRLIVDYLIKFLVMNISESSQYIDCISVVELPAISIRFLVKEQE